MRGQGIGELSRRVGVNIETIRYYERVGLMPDPGRTLGGNRQYDLEHVKRLSFIRRSRELGFSIEEIKNLLQMVDREDFTCAEVHDLTVDHLATVRKKLADLQKIENVLVDMVAECGRGDIPDCPIVEALFSVD